MIDRRGIGPYVVVGEVASDCLRKESFVIVHIALGWVVSEDAINPNTLLVFVEPAVLPKHLLVVWVSDGGR